MQIYTINNNLLVHANQIIHDGTIQVINNAGNLVKEYSMNRICFNTFPLLVSDGKYLVRVKSEKGRKEKYIDVIERKN